MAKYEEEEEGGEQREGLPSTQSRASQTSLAGRMLHNREINFFQNNLQRSPFAS